MTRWILLVLALIGFTLVLAAKSVGLLALGLLLGIVGLFGFIFAMAAARVAAGARPDASMAAPEDLIALGKRGARTPPPRPDAPVVSRDDRSDQPN